VHKYQYKYEYDKYNLRFFIKKSLKQSNLDVLPNQKINQYNRIYFTLWQLDKIASLFKRYQNVKWKKIKEVGKNGNRIR